jgi:hypothetical protein
LRAGAATVDSRVGNQCEALADVLDELHVRALVLPKRFHGQVVRDGDAVAPDRDEVRVGDRPFHASRETRELRCPRF